MALVPPWDSHSEFFGLRGFESFQDTLSVCTLRPRLHEEAFQALLLYICNFIFSLGFGLGENRGFGLLRNKLFC